MRVLHIQKVTAMGGSERHLLDLLPALSANGIDIRMVVPTKGDFAPFTGPMRAAGIDTVTVPSGPDLNPGLAARLRREIRRFQPDLVHTHLLHADLHGQAAAAVVGIPGVSSVHGTSWSYRRWPYRDVARLAGRLPARTIAISHYVAKFLTDRRLAHPDRLRVVHYGLNVARWRHTPLRDPAARAAVGVGHDDFVVGVASRLVPHKGHDVLFRAVAELVEDIPGLRVLVAGVGVLESELRTLARACAPEGQIRFLGYVSDIERVLAACDVVAFPSLPAFGEGFGLVALEAMASGRAVVASSVDSLPEIVVPDRTGYLVAPDDARELAAVLRRLAMAPALRERLGREARKHASTAFTLDAMVAGTAAVYEEALAAGRPSRTYRTG